MRTLFLMGAAGVLLHSTGAQAQVFTNRAAYNNAVGGAPPVIDFTSLQGPPPYGLWASPGGLNTGGMHFWSAGTGIYVLFRDPEFGDMLYADSDGTGDNTPRLFFESVNPMRSFGFDAFGFRDAWDGPHFELPLGVDIEFMDGHHSTFSTSGVSRAFVGFIAPEEDGLIRRVQLSSQPFQSGDQFSIPRIQIDNFTHGPGVAPEPSTILMLSTGLAALMFAGRNRRRN